MDLKTCTRQDWEAYNAEQQRETGAHGFDPGMPWHIATWGERALIVFFYAVLWGLVFPALLCAGLWVIGTAVDGIAISNSQHDACLKHATNGYEIRQCR
jgi:hypothetical protein